VEKYVRDGQATDHNITGFMHFACWIIKATDTQIQNIKHLLLFHCNNGYAKASNITFIRKSPALLPTSKALSSSSE
jgi:hypothetical protein